MRSSELHDTTIACLSVSCRRQCQQQDSRASGGAFHRRVGAVDVVEEGFALLAASVRNSWVAAANWAGERLMGVWV